MEDSQAMLTSDPIRTSVRPRAGRRFEPIHEKRLATCAIRAIESLPAAQNGLLIVTEMTGPYGVPDFVAVVGNQASMHNRLALPVPPLLNEIDAAIVSTVRTTQGMTSQRIAGYLNWPLETIERRIPTLLRLDALTKSSARTYTRVAHLRTIGTILAVETKIRDWHKAVQQCRRYQIWADNYILVMDQLGKEATKRIVQEVSIDRGGLVLGERWVQRPVKRTMSKSRRLWASEHLIAALGHQPSACP